MDVKPVLTKDDSLFALVPPMGPKSETGVLRAFLKLATGTGISVKRSTLELSGASGKIAIKENAFGLVSGMHLGAPCSEKLVDDARGSEPFIFARWRLNDLLVEAETPASGEGWRGLRIIFLPLQVNLPTDCHMVFTIVNLGNSPIDIATGMREAICWADQVAYESVAALVWNGPYLISPGQTSTRCFRLSDFPGAPRHGRHEMSLRMFGQQSAPELVTWRGQPWRESEPISGGLSGEA